MEASSQEELPVGAVVLDADGRILHCDPSASRLLGWDAAEAVGRSLFQALAGPVSYAALLPLYTQMLRDGSLDLDFSASPDRRRSTVLRIRLRPIVYRTRTCGLAILEQVLSVRGGSVSLTESELYKAATRDPVTGLPNRPHFVDMLSYELNRCRRTKSNGTFVLVVLDEERIAPGSEEYDRLVGAIARVLRKTSRTTDIIARLGGHRFGVLLTATDLAGARRFVDRVRRSLNSASRAVGGEADRLVPFFGLAMVEETQFKPVLLLQAADRAAAEARRAGPGQAVVASPRMSESRDRA